MPRKRRMIEQVGPEEYDRLLELQGGVCAICGVSPKTRRLHIDHVHGTDPPVIRGLLCHRCNRALPSWMTRAWLWNAVLYLDDDTLDVGVVYPYAARGR